MLNTAGLSIDQAPPISVPFRFFLTAPFYLLCAGILFLLSPDALASRWSPSLLAIVHLVALGFMTQIMLGSLFQLLPVLTGTSIGSSRGFSTAIWVLLNVGTPMIATGLFLQQFFILALGAALAGGTLILFALITLRALIGQQPKSSTVLGIILALVSLVCVVLYGGYLAMLLNSWLQSTQFISHVDRHAVFALAGWLGLLVVSISYQLQPMFFVTQEYPVRFKKIAVPLAFVLLITALVFSLLTSTTAPILIPLSLLGAVYALISFSLLWRRRRKRLDPVVLHWYLIDIAIFLASVSYLLDVNASIIGVLLLFGVGVVMPSGALLKIIPFLSWMHLQERQIASGNFSVRVPNMNGFVGDWPQRIQISLLTLLAIALVVGLQGHYQLVYLVGVLAVACGINQFYIYVAAIRGYHKVQKDLQLPAPDTNPNIS